MPVEARVCEKASTAYLHANPDVAASPLFKHIPRAHWEHYGKVSEKALFLRFLQHSAKRQTIPLLGTN